MNDHLAVLKRVGAVLLIVGVIDIAYMAYCIASGRSYSSSLNIFAVIAGVFLWRGHLGAVRIITRFAALLLAGAVGATLLLFPTLAPADLWLVEFKLNPIATLVGLLVTLALVGLVIWVYRELRDDAVVQALGKAGLPTTPPKGAFVIGAAIPVFLAIIFHFTLGGAAGAKAIELAKAEYGNQYRYSPSSINLAGNHVSARVTAYNEHEIKTVVVQWSN